MTHVNDFLRRRGYKIVLEPKLSELLSLTAEELLAASAIRSGKHSEEAKQLLRSLKLHRKLLPHQQKGVLKALTVRNPADFSVPGSGKTQVALSVFAAFKKQKIVRGLFVIGPPSSFVPWEEEYTSVFGSRPRVLRVKGSPKKRRTMLADTSRFDLILCSYHMADRERDSLAAAMVREQFFLVLDESHHVKNIELRPWGAAVLGLAPLASRRMILSGTPAPHSLRDLWTQFTFLWPSKVVLGSRSEFEQLAAGPSAVGRIKRALLPFFHRTKRTDLKLPNPVFRYELISHAEIPPRQRLIIQLLELRTIQDAKRRGLADTNLDVLRALRRARIIRMLQAATNPALLTTISYELGDPSDPKLEEDPSLAKLLRGYSRAEVPAKVRWAVNKIRELAGQGVKVVVWTSFIGNIKLLERLLKEFSPLLAYGGVPAYEEDVAPGFESREANIRLFKTSAHHPVLIANPGACSESISLHKACQHAIYMDRTFNCGQFLQSMDRINRVGMPPHSRAHYYVPLVQCAIEQVLDRRLSERQKVLYALMDDDMPVLGYSEEWSLFEREDDLDVIFGELVQELSTSAITKRERPSGRARRHR